MGCLENSFIYFPVKFPDGDWNIEQQGFPVEDCFFQTGDNLRLHGFFSPYPKAETTLLWFHGNGGNIGHRLEHLRILRELKVNIFIFDYRGYGKSQGSPCEQGLYRDSEAAYNYLLSRKEVNPARIYLYGQSLGASQAIYLASQGKGAGVIAEAGFTNLPDIGVDLYPWLPARLLTTERYDSLKRISGLKMPVLIIYGDQDEIIPIRHSQRLYEAAPKPKTLLVIKGARHNDIYQAGTGQYLAAIKKFILS